MNEKNQMSFEEALKRLDEVVKEMEKSHDSIEKLTALYEEACELIVYCREVLNTVNSRVRTVDERIMQRDTDQPD